MSRIAHKYVHISHIWVFVLGITLLSPYVAAQQPASSTVPTSASPLVEAGPIQENPEDVLRFWNDERIKDAEGAIGSAPTPPDEPPITPGSDEFGFAPSFVPYSNYGVSRVTGILVFSFSSGTLSHCTASILTSRSQSLVLTAAHCVKSGE